MARSHHYGPPAARLAKRSVAMENGCVEWVGSRNGNGYGQIRFAGRMVYVHRLAYETHIGPIPPGLTIDHLCRNRACINPDHLEAVTNAVNIRRGGNAQKTHCPAGHEYTPENVYQYGSGRRQCRECALIRRRTKPALR